MKIKDIGEIALIKRLAGRMRPDKSVIRGIGDDAAVIRWTKDKYLLLTCDMLVEDVHFRLGGATPYQIGRKALARNVSDIAAMGGFPRYALVSVGIRPETTLDFADGLYRGMADLARKSGISIVGGDTTRSRKLVIDISLAGEVEKKNLVLRSTARPQDLIFVTGSIGGSSKGRHLDFEPRLAEARQLVKNFKVNSMIDISDGLLLDLHRILEASKTGAVIYERLIPLSRGAGAFKKAVSEGEDFELLFTMGRKEAERFLKTGLKRVKTPVTLIGHIMNKASGYRLVGKDGRVEAVKPEGYLHF